MNAETLGARIQAWAEREPTVQLCVLIGSRVRDPAAPTGADAHSDWDFQIATSQPQQFETGAWLVALGMPPLAYALRPGRLGSALKASAVTALGELDLVVIPVDPLREVVRHLSAGFPIAEARVRQALIDLSAVLAGGYRFLKGDREFADFFARVVREVPPARLDNPAVCRLAEAFVCDYVVTCRRIDRGEWLAAQRWLHHQLAETNFRLLHELRLRGGRTSFPDARWLECLSGAPVDTVRVAALPEATSLRRAVEGSAETLRALVAQLVGEGWRWPDLVRVTPAR